MMERPTTINLSGTPNMDYESSDAHMDAPTPTAENPLGFFHAYQPSQPTTLPSKRALSPLPPPVQEEEEELSWSAGTIHDGSFATSAKTDRAPDACDGPPPPTRARLWHDLPAVMQRTPSCQYDSRESAPSRLLAGTSGGHGMFRSYSNPVQSLELEKARGFANAQEEDTQAPRPRRSPMKRSAASVDVLPKSSLGSQPNAHVQGASHLYNNPYQHVPPTTAQHSLQPKSPNTPDSRPRPNLGRFLSYDPAVSAREQSTVY